LPEEWLIEWIQQVGANRCKLLFPSFVVIWHSIAAVFRKLRDIFVTVLNHRPHDCINGSQRSAWPLPSIRSFRNSNSHEVAVARRLQINQPKISALSNYRLEGFSVERLMKFLIALDRDVEIVFRRGPTSRKAATILVTAA